ncbi:hypothetical protein [Rhizobacter sp. Root1221]|uniref:hypothetical protein n=1 Tax=Rhizobacter sp. Root1221 TaxID=1736433 RepID=UPI0006F5047B|nr:hypothetical protein [Rhizobacter sp. Root1221]KQW01233.1 hypothetical protein ASC87_15185 [Rhizobacter sp. Root1221]
MKLDPFVCVGTTPFSATRDDIVRARGAPRSEVRNGVGLTALDYGDAVFRFQDSGRLEEVTLATAVLHLGVVAVPFARLEAFVEAQDEAAFRRAGFLVSPRFGLAFDPSEPFWVTALARHCIGEWQAL